MKYRTLGRTGLKVSLVGIGSGGPSQFGQKSGVAEENIRKLTHHALDRGINFFDTAATYGESETIMGRALKGVPRESYILATKFKSAAKGSDRPATPEEVTASVERSLRRLQVDCIDLLQFHAVKPDTYATERDILMETLNKLRDQGKFRFLGTTESYSLDTRHEMLVEALHDDLFDTIMVGYNLLSPTAEKEVLPLCQEKNVGVICMVAVRKALSRPELLLERIADAKARGVIAKDSLPEKDPLGWLVQGEVKSVPAAAYKFVTAHPAISTVLTGTSRIEHLDDNIEAILGPSLPEEHMARLRSVFGDVWEALAN